MSHCPIFSISNINNIFYIFLNNIRDFNLDTNVSGIMIISLLKEHDCVQLHQKAECYIKTSCHIEYIFRNHINEKPFITTEKLSKQKMVCFQ